ncbi:MAG: hypothetical protein PHD45_09995 [Bacteroidales bacterium]|nr:hypothetical protein [Bacteroidales bacterium]HHT03500.1 hypothetical protein [Bacteroidales bacterium]
MQRFKIYIITSLFILGLIVSPKISFNDNVDIALKFESGLSVKKNSSKGLFNTIISFAKTDSKTNLKFILTDYRFGTSKVENSSSGDNVSLFSFNNKNTKYSYYITSTDNRYYNKMSIYQLNSIRL